MTLAHRIARPIWKWTDMLYGRRPWGARAGTHGWVMLWGILGLLFAQAIGTDPLDGLLIAGWAAYALFS